MGEKDSRKVPFNVLTFEELRTVQKRGRNNDSLQELGPEFLDRIARYLKLKRSLGDRLSSKEYENAVRVISDILELRERKLIRLAALAAKTKIPIKNVSDSEKEFLKSLKMIFEKHHKFVDTKIGIIRGAANEQELKELQEEKQQSIEQKTEVEKDAIKKENTNETASELIENQIKENTAIEPMKIEPLSNILIENTEEVRPEKEILKIKTTPVLLENKESEELNEILSTEQNKKEIENKQIQQTKEIKSIEQSTSKEILESQMHKIRIKSAVPKFLGVNLEVYGPFNSGDEINLPLKNAEVLINQGIAEVIKSPVSSA